MGGQIWKTEHVTNRESNRENLTLLIRFQIMYKELFLCRFNGIVYFVSSLLISLPSGSIIFSNSNFLHIIPFIDFASQFTCNPWGVFIGDPFILKWGMLINHFHK